MQIDVFASHVPAGDAAECVNRRDNEVGTPLLELSA
jgi:hypothetical protein